MRSASSWNVELVVRPQPGQAVTLGENDRSPRACSSSHAAYTSSRRSPPGRGVSDTRIVSPMPSSSRTPIAAGAPTSPLPHLPGFGQAEMQGFISLSRQGAVDADEVARPRGLARDDDLVLPEPALDR